MNSHRISKKYINPDYGQEKLLSFKGSKEQENNPKLSKSQYLQLGQNHKLITEMDKKQTQSIDRGINLNSVRKKINQNSQNRVEAKLPTLSSQGKFRKTNFIADTQNKVKQMHFDDHQRQDNQKNLGSIDELISDSTKYDKIAKHKSEHIQSQLKNSYFNNNIQLTQISQFQLFQKVQRNAQLGSNSQDQISAAKRIAKASNIDLQIQRSNQQPNRQVTLNSNHSQQSIKIQSEAGEIQFKRQQDKVKRFISPFDSKTGSLPHLIQTNVQQMISISISAKDIEAKLLKNISLFNPHKKRRSSTRISRITNLPESINKWMKYLNHENGDHNKGKSIKDYYAQYHIPQEQTLSHKDKYFSIFDEQVDEGHYIEEKNNSHLIHKFVNQQKQSYFIDWRFSKKGQNFLTPKLKVFNHLQNNEQLFDKVNLYTNTKKYCRLHNINMDEIMPRQFNLNFDLDNIENQVTALTQQLDLYNDIKLFSDLSSYFSNKLKFDFSLLRRYKENLFIVKPSHLYENIGVHNFSCLKELFLIIEQYYEGCREYYNRKIVDQNGELIIRKQKSLIYSKQFLIQQYIDNQMTINGQQFTLKYYILISAKLRVFMALDCLVYLKQNNDHHQQAIYSKEYFIQSLTDHELLNSIENKIIYQTQCVLNACKDQLKQPHFKNQFELCQVEFIIDDELNPRLIDVEANLHYETYSELLKQYIPDLVNEALAIIFQELNVDESDQPPEEKLHFWRQII